MSRSTLLPGLRLTLRHPGPLLWAYAFNVTLAWLASATLRSQYSNVTRESLAAQRLISGFDLGVALDATRRLADGPSGSFSASLLGVPAYLLIFFLLVPGTLLTYQTDRRLSFGTLVKFGLDSLWSFVRIVLLTLAVTAPVLILLGAIGYSWSTHVEETTAGRQGFLQQALPALAILLIAPVFRLFFDLAEIHAVRASQTPRVGGAPERRIRKALKPAWESLRSGFPRLYLTFVLLALIGAAGYMLLSLSALHHLAQPRAWPTLVLAQLGLFWLLFCRFWQRAAEAIHVQNVHPVHLSSRIFAPRLQSPWKSPSGAAEKLDNITPSSPPGLPSDT